MTKRVKYSAIWKESIKIVKESKLSFFTTFPSSIFYSLLHNFIIFPQFFIPSFTILIFSLTFIILPPPPHFIIYIFYPRPHRPHIDPTLRIKIVKLYTTTFLLFPSSTTANTFLLFFLHHHYHHISVVSLWPPSSHCYCFAPPDFGYFGMSLAFLVCLVGKQWEEWKQLKCGGGGGGKTIQTWWWWWRETIEMWWWRENDRNV